MAAGLVLEREPGKQILQPVLDAVRPILIGLDCDVSYSVLLV